MKFLLEFVTCCGPMRMGTSQHRAEAVVAAEEEGTRWLAASIPARRRRRKRRVYGPASAVAETEWKPTLCAISEDTAVVVMVEKTKKKEEMEVQTAVGMGSEMVATRKTGSRARVHVRSYSDERRHMPIIPAFAPAPFMF
ncbi:hypothetical protein FCV25MIE_26799 [Fagus crenata]